MKPILFFMLIAIPWSTHAQSLLIGKVVDENGNAIPNAFVINMKNNQNLLADDYGIFSINAKQGDEIRVLANRFERQSKILTADDFKGKFMISLLPRIQTIEEVKIGYKPTGHLETDLGKLYRDKELEDLKKKLTMALNMAPDPNEIRPTLRIPSTFNNQIPLSGASIVIDLFGKRNKPKKVKNDPALRMINNVGTIYSAIGTQFFENLGIPKDKVTGFIVFVLKKNNLEKELKENNYNIIRNTMSDNAATFLNGLQQKSVN
ncbi:hypothetical protein I6H88_10180 [Elizabethkingia bruuniana]|uniref:TonB-dependent receptor n=2 Tax=Elizabethkingia bruuniana TaxID=1756149 RepID=A0A7T8A0T7_9FLAO|nr:hypothetical protein [Elizabethkingia bruuniana]KGO09354.1 hypothetical protein KS04_15040 [Elizabethkingia miricola]AQX87174.1 hypothetical protein AYC65_20175 [Elizabethkingia bruuniana]KUY23871.1 hypothetical protein ATB97_10875 [Elizabethkingia bruuniana]OPB61537.1 hypothetical protein BAY12_13750 [Elizabethkingia bruuniana]QQN60910.1 hypothetical protein I6H88_10180 [Elizabethkingia bruuniana]